MPSPFTVLHYTGYDHAEGGIVAVIRNLADEGRFHCLHGVSPRFSPTDERGLKVWRGPPVEGDRINPLNMLRALRAAVAVRRWLRVAPDRIFHGHTRGGQLVGLCLRLLGESRLVVSVHVYGRQRWFYRLSAFFLGRRFFWLSPTMRNYYGVCGVGWSQCVPECVKPSKVCPASPVKGRLRLGGIGMFVRWKRWDLIIEALAQLGPQERARVSFTHIGGRQGKYSEEIFEFVAKHGLDSQVVFRGVEASSEKILSEIDALVVASHNEPFSVAMLEALAAGVPVIAADSGGSKDIICPGVNGYLFHSDASSLAAQIHSWLRTPFEFDRGVIRGTAPKVDQIAQQWAEIYSGL